MCHVARYRVIFSIYTASSSPALKIVMLVEGDRLAGVRRFDFWQTEVVSTVALPSSIWLPDLFVNGTESSEPCVCHAAECFAKSETNKRDIHRQRRGRRQTRTMSDFDILSLAANWGKAMCCQCLLWKQCSQSYVFTVWWQPACVCAKGQQQQQKEAKMGEDLREDVCVADLVADAFLMLCLSSRSVCVHFLVFLGPMWFMLVG